MNPNLNGVFRIAVGKTCKKTVAENPQKQTANLQTGLAMFMFETN